VTFRPDRPGQLGLVVARDAEHVAGADHAHHPPQYTGCPARGRLDHRRRSSGAGRGAPDRASLIIADDRVASSASRVSTRLGSRARPRRRRRVRSFCLRCVSRAGDRRRAGGRGPQRAGPAFPGQPEGRSGRRGARPGVLDLTDVVGDRVLETAYLGRRGAGPSRLGRLRRRTIAG
jgi:hypothetical protein